MPPSIAGGDSGELVAEGCQLGTSHPPGYPLYTILIFIVTNIGNTISNKKPATLANGMSTCFGAIASGLITSSVLYLIQMDEEQNQCLRTKGKKGSPKRSYAKKINVKDKAERLRACQIVVAIVSGLFHTISPLAWQYSITAEVFALHNLFVSMIAHTSIRFAIYGTQELLFLGAFVCGMSLTNQHTSILLIVPVILWVLYETDLYKPSHWTRKVRGDRLPLVIQAALCFLSGFIAFYATLPLFSMAYPHSGSWGDVVSIEGFVNHFRRKDYGTFRLFSGNDQDSEDAFERTLRWFEDYFWVQATPKFGTLTILGCLNVIQREIKRLCWGTSLAINTTKGANTSMSIIIGPKGSKYIDVRSMIFFTLVFYLIVFHSLANLPLRNPLLFGVHQVSAWTLNSVIASQRYT